MDNILASDLLDPELIHSAASFLESIHLNVGEFISIYKAKTKFVEKIKVMVFQQQQRIELAELKHKHNLELLREKMKEGVIDVQEGTGGYEFNTDEIIKSLSKAENYQTVKFSDSSDDIIIEDDNDEDEENENKEDTKHRK